MAAGHTGAMGKGMGVIMVVDTTKIESITADTIAARIIRGMSAIIIMIVTIGTTNPL